MLCPRIGGAVPHSPPGHCLGGFSCSSRCAQPHPGESLGGFRLCSTELRFKAADSPLCWVCRCLGCWHWGVRVHSRGRAAPPQGPKNPSAPKSQKKTPTILGSTWKWQHMLNVQHQPLPKAELFWAHPEDAGRADASLPPPGSSLPGPNAGQEDSIHLCHWLGVS